MSNVGGIESFNEKHYRVLFFVKNLCNIILKRFEKVSNGICETGKSACSKYSREDRTQQYCQKDVFMKRNF